MTEASSTTGAMLAIDGTRLFYREWPCEKPRAVMVIVHGLGEHGGRYAHVARRMNSHDIAVRIPDLRGHGKSDGPRGMLNHHDDLLDDLKLMVDDFAIQQGHTPILLGHSMGGLLAARFATGGWSAVRGLVLSSPAFALNLSLYERLLHACTSHLMPSFCTDTGIARDHISHDPAVLADAESDPLNHHRISVRLLDFMLDAIAHVQRDAAYFPKPTLLLVAGDDRIVRPQGSRDFYERLPKESRTMHVYDDAYHEILNEDAPRRARVLNDLCDWIETQIPKPARFGARPVRS